MSDSFSSEPHRFDSVRHDPHEDVPQFGLVDVIEAFTAMRHEWRGQTRESRELVEALQRTASQIADLENKLLVSVSNATNATRDDGSDQVAMRLAETIAEIDSHVTRAVAAVTSASEASEGPRVPAGDVDQLKQSLQHKVAGLGGITRWFFKAFVDDVMDTVSDWAGQPAGSDPSVQGLRMLVQRVRRLMAEQLIVRIETTGQRFDAQTMTAVDAIATDTGSSGHVIEQFSPAYRWRGKVIKFAEVRVAK